MAKFKGFSFLGLIFTVAIILFMFFVVPKYMEDYQKNNPMPIVDEEGNSEKHAHPYVAAYKVGTSRAKHIKDTINNRLDRDGLR